MKLLILPALVLLASLSVVGSRSPAYADHKDNGHAGYLYPYQVEGGARGYADQYEMNSKTTNGEAIPVRFVAGNIFWFSAYARAMQNWSDAIRPISGFDPFTNSSLTGFMSFEARAAGNCTSAYAHGCVRYWDPSVPSGTIFMDTRWVSAGPHATSDIMHEMGHALVNANEHYPAYNCTSIMGHSAAENAGSAGYCGTGTGTDILTAVTEHDKTDYRDAYGVKDTGDAAYVTMYGAGALVHYFEGGYLGGNGRTIHQEYENVVDRSTSGLGGQFFFYNAIGRRVDNSDNPWPESQAYVDVPAAGAEWCMTMRGHSRAVLNSWGPTSKRYCIARSGAGSGVFVTSDRNGTATFRVWNFTGADITNVQLRTDPAPGVQICYFGTVPNWSVSGNCSVTIAGPGYLTVWYNGSWIPLDTIGYDQ